jgi:exonuclease III
MHRNLKILSHNIRGINSDIKWNSMRNSIMETNCDILCIQETRKIPLKIPIFVIGASGGFITIWKSSHFDVEVIQ